jgi:hypothetical protein
LSIGNNILNIEYSSPSVRDRKIFGSSEDYLVEFGKIWRTGANEATTFSTLEDIKIDTFDLPKGKYALFTIPNENSWEIIFNKEWSQWGTHNRKDSLDAVRLFVKPVTTDSIYEQMQFILEDQTLKFYWDNLSWTIPIN